MTLFHSNEQDIFLENKRIIRKSAEKEASSLDLDISSIPYVLIGKCGFINDGTLGYSPVTTYLLLNYHPELASTIAYGFNDLEEISRQTPFKKILSAAQSLERVDLRNMPFNNRKDLIIYGIKRKYIDMIDNIKFSDIENIIVDFLTASLFQLDDIKKARTWFQEVYTDRSQELVKAQLMHKDQGLANYISK